MSTDWAKYSTPLETQQRARTPADNAVIKILVGKVRAMPGQRVEHTPILPGGEIPPNRAHTDVWGEKTAEVRVKLLEIYEMVIQIG
jgi:hypothetical protein